MLEKKDGDFSLQKYFDSYRKIKQKPEFKDGKIKDCIIYTNINFNFVQLQTALIEIKEIIENDEILNMESGVKSSKRYKLVPSKEIYDTLKNVFKTFEEKQLGSQSTIPDHTVENEVKEFLDHLGWHSPS